MNAWQQRAVDVLKTILGVPPTEGMLVLYACVAVLTFLAVFNRLTRLLKFPISGLACSVLITVLAMLLILAGAWLALANLGPLPFVRKSNLLPWIPYFGGILPLFLLVAPLMRLICRSRYGESLSALLLAMAAVACAVGITYSISTAVISGDKEFNVTRERTTTMNRFLNE